MRARLALGLALAAIVLLAWLFARAWQPEGYTLARPVLPDSLAHPAQSPEAEPGLVEKPQSPPGRSHPDGALFEPLPEDPSGILVHLRDAATHAPVLGAEVFVCEEERWDWSSLAYDSDAPWPDVEAELRARGRRIESDAQGDLQLPVPSAWLAVMARKDERFGALTLGFENAPEAQLDLCASGPCLVRLRDAAGRPVAGEQLVLATQNGNAFWRGASDATGTARVPNLGWRIADGCGDSETWFAMANDACAAAPMRWFARAEPAPSAFELVVGDAQRVRLHVVASDGTRVPIDGHVVVSPRSTSGSTSVLRLPRRTNPELSLARGEALIARGEPGGWLDLEVGLAGSVSFEAALRVPARGEAAGELTLRMPAELQVLLLHPTDEQGMPLARQEFEWVSWEQLEGDDRQLDQHIDRVRSDETGLLVLAIGRASLVQSGALRLHGARELESATFPFAALGADAVHDHGALALAGAQPLVRGRVVDDRGQPLAQVRIGLEQLHVWDGDHELESLAGVETKSGARTDADGRFVLYGKCLGGQLQLNLTREGYLAPRGSEQELFECGSSPDLQLVLMRPAELETSARVPARLDRRLVWLIDDGSPDTRMEEIEPPAGGGLLVHDHAGFLPGTYRVSLRELDDSTAPPILEVENVLLRPGERTLDPRLLDVDLMRFALAGNAPPPELHGAPIVLEIRDLDGRPLSDGRLVERFGDFSSVQEWHGGRVRIEPNMQRASLTVWSPGRLAWIGECPEQSGELRLQPAPMLKLQVRIPPELRRADWHFRVEPRVVSSDQRLWDIATPLAPADVDADGSVAFEIPGEFTLGLSLVAFVLDPSGTSYREGSAPCSVTYLTLEVPAGDEPHPIAPTPEEWAAAEKALAVK